MSIMSKNAFLPEKTPVVNGLTRLNKWNKALCIQLLTTNNTFSHFAKIVLSSSST